MNDLPTSHNQWQYNQNYSWLTYILSTHQGSFWVDLKENVTAVEQNLYLTRLQPWHSSWSLWSLEQVSGYFHEVLRGHYFHNEPSVISGSTDGKKLTRAWVSWFHSSLHPISLFPEKGLPHSLKCVMWNSHSRQKVLAYALAAPQTWHLPATFSCATMHSFLPSASGTLRVSVMATTKKTVLCKRQRVDAGGWPAAPLHLGSCDLPCIFCCCCHIAVSLGKEVTYLYQGSWHLWEIYVFGQHI